MTDEHPLGTLETAWNTLPSGQKDLIKQIEDYDLSWLQGKDLERQGVTDIAYHDDAIRELKRFLAVKVLYDPHPLGMISPLVGAAWHAFILHTAEYGAFCEATYGKLIHHVPGGGTGKNQTLWIGMYRALFGDFPRIWALGVDGAEMPKYMQYLNVDKVFANGTNDMDSDDGAYP